jgi:fatty-acyl-CoA synthase
VKGLMQDVPLAVPLILARAMTVGASMTVTSVEPAGSDTRTWAEVGERALRLAAVLDVLGVSRGGAVGSFAWNGHRHLELYYGIPAAGRVLHTVNVRLHPDDVEYVVGHARDEAIFVDASLTAALAPLRRKPGNLRYVVMEDGGEVDAAFADDPRYEELLSSVVPVEPEPIDEASAASICFTSGTTGRPKAVVYSHRSVVLHAMAELMVDGHAVRRSDTILPLTPMFHVNCWGLPYAAGLAPASLVFAGSDTSPTASARLIEESRATVLAGIPTFWIQMESTFDSEEYDLSSVRRILCGGAEAPPPLIQRYNARGIDFFHAWGMTEMSPSGTGNWIRSGDEAADYGPGVPAPLVELRLVDQDGAVQEWDGENVGELQARGPWVAAEYFEPDDKANETRFDDGWLKTGDVARIGPGGKLEIVDRTKDLVKSGGEWISSVELERAMAGHPAVMESAVVAVPHAKWGERPAALVVLRPGSEADEDDLRDFLGERVASWWLPDIFLFVANLPKTGVGKLDKKRLREDYSAELARAIE